MSKFLIVAVLCPMVIDLSPGEEPHCQSRYDYDYKLMQKILELEQKLQQLQERSKEDGGSSVYTRWGRNKCGCNASMVYTGYIAGKKYNEKGSGGDTLCLPSDPTWLDYKNGVDHLRGFVYGTETSVNDDHGINDYPVNDQDLPCTVCKTSKQTVLMIPGRGTCYAGWTLEYKGYLMANYHDHAAPYNHICVDARPEFLPNGGKDNGQHILYFMEARCGSLPCPPYVEGHELACVVCSI